MHQPQLLEHYLEALGPLVTVFHGRKQILIQGACSDSREVCPGWLFVAIPGARQDGTAFVSAAVEMGASAIVAARPVEVPPRVAYIQVSNAYAAAGRIAEASAGFPARSLKMIGITGTNGKTTCAYLVRDMLRAGGIRTGMIGTVQYESGSSVRPADRTTPTPFEFQRILAEMREAHTEAVVMEVSSHALDQRRPGTTRFQAGLFTNLTGDHCDYHLTMENYFAAKGVLFEEYLAEGAPAVINTDDPYGRRLAAELKDKRPDLLVRSCGTGDDCDYRIISSRQTLHGTGMEVQIPGSGPQQLETPLIGAFNVHNAVASAALALESGVPMATVAATLRTARGAPGRLQLIAADNDVRVFVDYAHTDDALRNVLTTLRALKPRSLSVVFGCGGDRDRSKRPRMGEVASMLADRVYITSDNPRTEDPAAIITEICAGIVRPADMQCILDRRAAIEHAVTEAEPGDVVLVAGKGHEDYQEIMGRVYPFNDVDEVQRVMREQGILV
jgi:UDP-N-acetylmuramoyl-L-alanyl-D-glutamate--2,6-diaminopimelate ligase